MKPLDKKQIPQVVVLVVLAVALFGYFAMKMILPTPAAAGTQAAPPPVKPQTRAVPAAPAAVSGAFTAPAPMAGMHDPFVPGVSDQPAPAASAASPKLMPAVRTASLKAVGVAPLSIPAVPALPTAGSTGALGPAPGGLAAALPSVPAAPVVPDWTVTGVLQSGAEHIAILRSGDTRRFVRQGEYVDGQFLVAVVTRDHVVLRHGQSRFMLPLGGARTAPVAPAKTAPASAGLPFPQTAAPTDAAPGTDLNALIGKPAAQDTPHPKDEKTSSPDVARAPVLRGNRRGSSVLARLPLPARRGPVCPTVRVAAYRSERTTEAPDGQSRGLLLAGVEAPDFSLSTLGGESFSLSQFRGNVVVLDFWASWYAPSARSLGTLSQLQKTLGAQGLTVLAVNSWDNRAGMQAALTGGDGSTMQLYDPGVSNESVAVRLYRAPDVPTFYVIDREGRVAGAFVGSGQGTVRSIQANLAKLGILS